MNLNSVHLNGLRAAEAAARCGSLAKAAEELGVSPSAVSQQIGRIELQLGKKLFERRSGGLTPTAFGALFTARLSVGFHELAQAVAMVDEQVTNTLVVSVPPAFASRWMVPRLSRFFALHPDILLRIDASTRLVDLERSDVELAIRMGEGKWPRVRAELLLPLEIFPVCSPELAKRLRTPADLANVSAIEDENTMLSWDRWFTAAGVDPVTPLPGATFTDPVLCLEAVIAGQGVMLAWQLLAADALADGRLVAPFGVTVASGLGYYLVTRESGRQSGKAAAFKRWVTDEVKATMAGFGSQRYAER